jgi:molecular chaperone DnaJ
MCRPKPCTANATPLEVLNLPKNFTDQDLRSAYKKAVLVWHPDRPVWQNASQEERQAATDMFRRVKEAYDMLCAKS